MSYNESDFLPLFKSIFFILLSIIIATSDFQKFSVHGDGFEMISFRYSQSNIEKNIDFLGNYSVYIILKMTIKNRHG